MNQLQKGSPALTGILMKVVPVDKEGRAKPYMFTIHLPVPPPGQVYDGNFIFRTIKSVFGEYSDSWASSSTEIIGNFKEPKFIRHLESMGYIVQTCPYEGPEVPRLGKIDKPEDSPVSSAQPEPPDDEANPPAEEGFHFNPAATEPGTKYRLLTTIVHTDENQNPTGRITRVYESGHPYSVPVSQLIFSHNLGGTVIYRADINTWAANVDLEALPLALIKNYYGYAGDEFRRERDWPCKCGKCQTGREESQTPEEYLKETLKKHLERGRKALEAIAKEQAETEAEKFGGQEPDPQQHQAWKARHEAGEGQIKGVFISFYSGPGYGLDLILK